MKREDLIEFFKPFCEFYLRDRKEWSGRGNMGHAFGKFSLKHDWHNLSVDLRIKIDGFYEAMVLLFKYNDQASEFDTYSDFIWWFTMNTCATTSGAFTGGDVISEPPGGVNSNLYKNIYYWLKLIPNI